MNRFKTFVFTKTGIVTAAVAASAFPAIVCILLGRSATDCIRTSVFVFIVSIASLMDIRDREVDNIFPACVLCFSFSFISLQSIPRLIIGAVFGLLVMLIPALILKKGKLGGADIKMSCAYGAFLGPFGLALSLGIAMPLALIYGLVKKDKSIPLIPFMSVGAVISILILE